MFFLCGVFILAKTGLLDNRPATTHGQLAKEFNGEHLIFTRFKFSYSCSGAFYFKEFAGEGKMCVQH